MIIVLVIIVVIINTVLIMIIIIVIIAPWVLRVEGLVQGYELEEDHPERPRVAVRAVPRGKTSSAGT